MNRNPTLKPKTGPECGLNLCDLEVVAETTGGAGWFQHFPNTYCTQPVPKTIVAERGNSPPHKENQNKRNIHNNYLQ